MQNPIHDKFNRPLHDLRISVIDRCNFRCPYCMPEEEYAKHYTFLKEKDWLTFDEITRLTKIFVLFGVVKIRLTGGEPLLRPNLEDLVRALSKIPKIEDLALTTNGSMLEEKAQLLKRSGLHRLTVSLDTLDSRVFQKMSGQKGSLQKILDGIKATQKCGFGPVKINIVVQKGVNDHTILDVVDYFRDTDHILRFIEYMDVGNCNHWDSKYVVPSEDIVRMISKRWPLELIEKNYFGEVAMRYRFIKGKGEVGFVSSVSQPFCQSCTRARLSTDGKIYTCLFSDKGIDLKTPLRNGASDKDLANIIHTTWQKRDDRYSELRSKVRKSHPEAHKVEMFQIGG